METTKKKVLLIDLDDHRRNTRVHMLKQAGYEVGVRSNYVEAHQLSDEGTFDLVVIALHLPLDETLAYSAQLSKENLGLPILLLTDWGVLVPRGTLARNVGGGDPAAFMREAAAMLAGSSHVREIMADRPCRRNLRVAERGKEIANV